MVRLKNYIFKGVMCQRRTNYTVFIFAGVMCHVSTLILKILSFSGSQILSLEKRDDNIFYHHKTND